MLTPIRLLFGVLALAIVCLMFVAPIAQDVHYHAFADDRSMLGIPNFWNVVSNLPFLLVGLWGLHQQRHAPRAGVARWIPIVFMLGVIATSFGSAYYHWAPENYTLVWDRLPMTIVFMSLFGLLLYDFVGAEFASYAFWIALMFGVATVTYWRWTESVGAGDLRPYALVQFFPILMAACFFAMFRHRVAYGPKLLVTVLFYAAAKVCEHFDAQVMALMRGLPFAMQCSGHTIKHLLAAVGLISLVQLMRAWPAQPGVRSTS